MKSMVSNSIESQVIRYAGEGYWLRHKKEILDIANTHGKLQTARKYPENSKAKRMKRREKLQWKYQWTYQLNTCINDLRAEGYGLRSIADQLGIKRRTLFDRRTGRVNKYLILLTLQKCEML